MFAIAPRVRFLYRIILCYCTVYWLCLQIDVCMYIYYWERWSRCVTIWLYFFGEKMTLSWHSYFSSFFFGFHLEVTWSIYVFCVWYRGKQRQSRISLLYYFLFKEKQLHCENFLLSCVYIISRGDKDAMKLFNNSFYSPFPRTLIYLTIFYSVSIFNDFIPLVSVFAITCIYQITCVITFN